LSKIIVSDERGQIVLEYVLLLVIAVGVAALITSTMVSRNPNSPGFLVKKWFEMIKTIGADTPDDIRDLPQ
jgi:hypothetical protein